MDIKTIEGATRVLGAPVGWDEATQGPCGGLPVRDEEHAPGVARMVSAWRPTRAELERLQAGAALHLYVIGAVHPPVALDVGDAPQPGMSLGSPDALRG